MVGHFNQALRSLLLLLRSAGTRYAVLTGLTIAAYSIVDKEGVGQVQPLLYVYFLGTGTALMLASYILARKGAAAVRAKWQANALPITVAGLLTFTADGLALTPSLCRGSATSRRPGEVGIVIGVVMGVFLLKEPFGGGRLWAPASSSAGW